MENNVVFIGKKPIMSYVLAVLTHLNSGNNSVVIKARGVTISKAVDVSQIIKKKLAQDIKIANLAIGSEDLKDKEERTRSVSYISIELTR